MYVFWCDIDESLEVLCQSNGGAFHDSGGGGALLSALFCDSLMAIEEVQPQQCSAHILRDGKD